MTDGYYGYKMDMWGIGCVIFEMLTFVPLFPGNDEYDQVVRIHNVIGTTPRDLIEKYRK
jgi:renal tumor antigen